jgi:LacI family transcriptional regulator
LSHAVKKRRRGAKPAGKPAPGRTGVSRGDGTIHAVAQHAGVSISTVSRFLNGKKRLSAGAEKRILGAVADLGYAPNRVAQSLRHGRTNTVGLILPDSSNPFFSGLTKGAEDTLREAGFALVLFNSNEDAQRERTHILTLQSLRCDGALVIAAPDDAGGTARWQSMRQHPLPIVFLDRIPSIDHDLVVVDNKNGGFEAGRHLAGLGHRRIAVIAPDYKVSSARDRVAGFRRALKLASVPLPKEYVVHVPPNLEEGIAAAAKLLQLPDPPTAIFATSNRLAIGTVAAIKAKGLSCPRDVSVIGYDSYEWQDVFEPRLTTIRQPSYQLGERGAAMLVDRMHKGPPELAEKVVLRAELLIRESCQPPQGASRCT